jgi:hypothetical protein
MDGLMDEIALRLPRTYDVDRLRDDLDALRHLPRAPQPGPYHDGDWTGISLHSQGGRPGAHPGYAGLDPYRETDAIRHTPYMKEILDGLLCPKRVVRLLVLPAGAKIGEHNDAGWNFQCGTLRLHVPIVTHPRVELTIAGQRLHWREGELWWGDFSKPHRVENGSAIDRVHLVIDVQINDFVLGLFPQGFVARKQRERPGIAMACPAIPTSDAELARFGCAFILPGPLMPLFGGGRKLAELTRGARAVARPEGGRLVVDVDGKPTFALERIGESEFAIVGQHAGCTFEIDARGDGVGGLCVVIRGLPEDLYAAQLGFQQGPFIPIRRVPLPLA